MAGHSRAVHKLEGAVEVITDVNRMERAASGNDFRQASNDVKLTPAQVRAMIYSFEMFDRNKDRGLDIDELASVFRACGQNPTKKQLQDIADEADADGNGLLDEGEYINLLKRHMHTSGEVEQEMRDAFAVFDRNGDGKVDKRELVNVLQMCDEPLTSEEADELINLIDDDKDGQINIDEFSSFLCNGTALRDIKTEKMKLKQQQQTLNILNPLPDRSGF